MDQPRQRWPLSWWRKLRARLQRPAPGSEQKAAPPFWRFFGASVAIVVGLVALAEELPEPVPASAPPAMFSEARAWEVVDTLSRRIGLRVSGTEGQRAAAEYLGRQLEAIPGLEVVTQTVPVVTDPDNIGLVFDASVTNIVARLPGEVTDAVVVSAHYDSPPESVGAADNAVAVGVALELARTLASGPRLRPTVIFNFNDGEELGLLGSTAFLAHPWRNDVRAFINLDAAGASGRALLFQTTEGGVALARAYAASLRPLGTVLAQDIFQSGVIPSSTDFGVYAGQGRLPGIDLALYRDGYAYHTDRDRPDRIDPGTLQHLGENLAGTLRALDLEDVAGSAGSPPPWYFDVLGAWMLVIPLSVGAWLPWVFLALGIVACVVTARRGSLAPARLLLAFGIVMGATLAAVASSAVVALVVGWVVGRPHGWYAHPWLVVTYGLLALAVFGALVRRACPRLVAPAELAVGSLGVWMALLVLAALAGAGSVYLAMVWVLAISATLLFAHRAPGGRFLVWIAWIVAAVVLAAPALIVLQVFLPLAGRLPLGPSFDPIAAALIALPAVLGVVALAAPFAVARMPRSVPWLAGLVVAIGLVLLAVLPPFSRERPQRIAADYDCSAAGCTWRVTSEDSLGAEGALGEAGTDAWPRPRPSEPRVTVTPGPSTSEGREVWLEIDPADALDVTLRLPKEGVLAWSTPVPYPRNPQIEDGSHVYLRRITPRQVWRVRLTLSQGKAFPVQVKHRWMPSSDVREALLRLLPEWTTVGATVSFTRELGL